MNKRKFLLKLKQALWGCAPSEISSRLAFYSEMIDDRMEEGLTEREAVENIGDPEQIAAEIRSELNERPKKEKRPLGAGAKVLIALGSPIWLSLLIAAAAVVLSVFVCLFSVWLSLYAVLAALGGSAIACVIGAIACALEGIFLQALFCAGASFVCAGLCIWFALLCVPIAKGFMHIMACLWIKCVRRREKA